MTKMRNSTLRVTNTNNSYKYSYKNYAFVVKGNQMTNVNVSSSNDTLLVENYNVK